VRGKNSCWKTWVTKGFTIESKISSKMHTIRVPIHQTKKGDNKHVKSKYGFYIEDNYFMEDCVGCTSVLFLIFNYTKVVNFC
jgi:hypothetical protein